MSLNKVFIMGHLGKDPELRMTTSQTPIANFSVATNERRKDQSGAWVDETQWHNIVLIGRSAETAQKFLKKGAQVFLEGSIKTRKWQDKEGKDRYTTEIVCFNFEFVGAKTKGISDSVEQSMGSSGFGAEIPSAPTHNPLPASLKSADSLAGSGKAAPSPSAGFEEDDIPF